MHCVPRGTCPNQISYRHSLIPNAFMAPLDLFHDGLSPVRCRTIVSTKGDVSSIMYSWIHLRLCIPNTIQLNLGLGKTVYTQWYTQVEIITGPSLLEKIFFQFRQHVQFDIQLTNYGFESSLLHCRCYWHWYKNKHNFHYINSLELKTNDLQWGWYHNYFG